MVLSAAFAEAPDSCVAMVNPRLLGRFFAGLGGTMKEGVGGAENA